MGELEDDDVDGWEAFHTETWGAEDEDTDWAGFDIQLVKEGEERDIEEAAGAAALSRTQSVTTHKQETPKQSPSKAAPKPSYSHVVRTTLRPHDPGKVSPDISHVTSHDTSTLGVSHDPRTCDPGNKPYDLPRDWSSTRSHVATWSPNQTHFKHAPSPLIGMWKTVGTINVLLNNQRSHKTLVRSTKDHPSSVFVPALKYGLPV